MRDVMTVGNAPPQPYLKLSRPKRSELRAYFA